MDTRQFKKLKKQIDKILEQAESEALREGVIISSPEFQELLSKLKEKLLAEYGISLEDFELMELEVDSKTQVEEEEVIKLGERTKEFSEARKKEFQQKTDELIDSFNNELQNLKSSFKNEIDNTKKLALTRKDIIDIVRPLIPKIPEPSDFDHPKILKELGVLNDKISEIIARDKTGDLKEDLFKMQSDFLDLYDKVKKIKIPKDYVQQSVLEPSIKDIIAPELNRALRSIQSQVYMVNKKLDDFLNLGDYIIGDGIAKITVGTTEPTSPTEGDLWCDTT